jgi:hypothetical protein
MKNRAEKAEKLSDSDIGGFIPENDPIKKE